MKLTTADYERIAEKMFAQIADNMEMSEPDTIDYEWLFEKNFERVAGEAYSEREYMEAFNSKPVQETMDEIKTFVREYWEDRHQTLEKVYGWAQGDFI